MNNKKTPITNAGDVTPVTKVSQEQTPHEKRHIQGLIIPPDYTPPCHGELYIQNGYVRILWRDKARKLRWKMLHRDVWEWAYGPIPPGYVIHHIDGNHLNNVLENLECLSRAEHSRLHAMHPELASPEGAAFYRKHRETSRKCCRDYYRRKKQNRTRDADENEPE